MMTTRTRRRHANTNTIVTDDPPVLLTQPHTHQDAAPLVESPRFPFEAYRETVRGLQAIIADRDNSGRNSYLSFWEGFPHGLSDLTFEMHRRVARVLGVERELAAGATGAERDRLLVVLRGDLQDLANYAIFGVMQVEKDAKE